MKLLKLGPIFQIIGSSVFFPRPLVGRQNVYGDKCVWIPSGGQLPCPEEAHGPLEWREGWICRISAPKAFPTTASKSCAPVIKVACSSVWIIVVTSMSASGVYYLGEPSNRRLHFNHAFQKPLLGMTLSVCPKGPTVHAKWLCSPWYIHMESTTKRELKVPRIEM